jgi:hypothetical protein
MAHAYDTTNIIEDMQREIIFAIKERLKELTRGTNTPIQLEKVVVRDTLSSSRESLRYYDIKNVFLDDVNTLCGDLAGKDDRSDVGVLFGKNIETLAVGDLKLLLDSLYSGDFSVDCAECDEPVPGRQESLYGFLMGKGAGLSRMLRR